MKGHRVAQLVLGALGPLPRFSVHVRARGTSPLDVPLDRALPSVPTRSTGQLSTAPSTRITVLENGVRVASEESLDLTSCVGIAVDKGSLLEKPEERGLSSMVRRMLLTSSARRDGQAMAEKLEELGASVIRSEAACRDSIYVAAEVLQPDCDGFIQVLSESLTHPSFAPEDVEFQKASLRFEREDIEKNPDALVDEMLFTQAFGADSPVGAPAVPPHSQIDTLTVDAVRKFHSDLVVGPNIVVAGIGIGHEELCASARKYLSGVRASHVRDATVTPAHFVGGDCVRFHEDLAVPLEPTLLRDETNPRVTLAFAAPSLTSPDFYAVSVLHGLMGGGSSFSSGGPGKGMYTRLFVNVLNRYSFCHQVKSVLHPLEGTSLFGMSAQCDANAVVNMVEVMASQLLLMAHSMSDEEFQRAKNKIKSDMFVDMESRIVAFDDLARQVCLWNRRVSSAEHARNIDAVSKDGALRMARHILAGPPVVCALGPKEAVQVIPSAQRIHSHLRKAVQQFK